MRMMNEEICFRDATEDDLLFIARGFHMAMLMEDTPDERIENFANNICSRDGVLYSPTNTIIVEIDGRPVGMLTAYDGSLYHDMRVRTMALVKEHLGIEFEGMEDEAQPGEYYLDSLAVLPEFRGRGIGRRLLQKGIEAGRRLGLKVTLAVDPVNEKAQKLYRSLGFDNQCNLFIFGHTYWKWYVV